MLQQDRNVTAGPCQAGLPAVQIAAVPLTVKEDNK